MPLAFALHLCQRLPYARLKILRDAAHGAALSHASAFVAEVRDFLSTAPATLE